MRGTQKLPTFSEKELSAYCRNLSMLIGSGISCEEAVLELCETGAKSVNAAALLVKENFTYSLAAAVRQADVFPGYMVGMLEAGEAAGRLEEVLERLAGYFDNLDAAKTRIQNAVLYPAAALGVLSVLLLLLTVKVLPIFSEVYSSFSGASAGVYIGVAYGVAWGVFAISTVLAVGLFALLCIWKSRRYQHAAEIFLRRFPVTGGCMRAMDLASFTSAFSVYTSGAMQPEEALHHVENMVEDAALRKKLALCREQVESGKSFSRAAVETELYTALYGRMLLNSEVAGKGTQGLCYLSDKLWEQAYEQLEAVVSGVEPLLSVVITAVVGVVLISVMLPLIGIMNAIG